MTIDRKTPLHDVAFEVCTALDRVGTRAVLTGGSAATFYAPSAVQSQDLDFVLTLGGTGGEPLRALEDLGYTRAGQHYTHAVNPYFLEFPQGPLAIGDELIETWDTPHEGDRLLHVLLPTDSCRDRLMWFYLEKDRGALEQALAVYAAQAGRIDLARIRRWSRKEGATEGFQEFERLAGG
ncbi:MAG TPA: hypothetical protein VMS76_20495 [Planctomycetota bacterium]|nr:hypothetical protein [Planctomycetota bacterium]